MPNYRIDVVIDSGKARTGRRAVSNELSAIERQAQRVRTSLNSAFAFAGMSLGVAGLVRMVDEFTNLQNRLRTVTSSTQQLTSATADLLAISNRTRSDFKATAELYARVGISARELGLSQKDLLKFTEGVNRAIILSGASAQEASAGLIQLSQGIASGTLRGDELRSVLEQLPAVADVISKHLGVTRGELRKMGEDGKITARNVIDAFQAADADLAARFAKTVPTIGQSFTVLKNNLTTLVGEFFTTSGAAEVLAGAILSLANNLDNIIPLITAAGTAWAVWRGAAIVQSIIGPMIALQFALGETSKLMAVWTGVMATARAAVLRLNLAIAANPIGAIAVGLTAVIALLYVFSDDIKVSSDGVVSLGNLASAVFDMILESVRSVTAFFSTAWDTAVGAVNAVLSALGTNFSTVMSNIGIITKASVNAIIGAWVFMFKTVQAVWSNFPGLMDVLFTAVVNLAASAAEKLLNVWQAPLRALASGLSFISEEAANGLNAALDNFSIKIPRAKVSAAGKQLGQDLSSAASSSFRDYLGAFWDEAMSRARQKAQQGTSAQEDFAKAVNKTGDASEKAAKKMKGAADKAKPFLDYLRSLNDEMDRLGKTNEEIKQIEVMGQAADAAAAGFGDLAGQIIETGAALVSAMNTQAALDFAKSLREEAQEIGKTETELRALAVARELEKAKTEEGIRAIREAATAREEAIRGDALKDFRKNIIQPLEDELTLLGMVADERARSVRGDVDGARQASQARKMAALDMEEEAQKAEWLAKGLTDVNHLWIEYWTARKAIIDQEDAIDRDTESVDRLNDALSRTLGILSQIGGASGVLGSILEGVMSGDFSRLGPAGGLINIALGGGDKYKEQAELIASRISDVFGVSGKFANTMANLLQGASTGALVGSMAFNNKSSQFGAMSGGALGQAIGAKVLGKLGSFAGPIGAIAGSLLGGIVGGLFSKTKKGSATIGLVGGDLGITSVTGNSASRQAAASSSAGGVISSLDKIASAFNATLGSAGVSIGVRKKDYVVDPTGAGRTKGSGVLNFGQDEKAAIQAAIKAAISNGVFQGLSAGVERLLKSGGDLETQLQKALDFQSVFTDLKQRVDPVGAANEEIDRWHDSMLKIFQEAGATGEELAKLEELTGLKRAEALSKANAAALDLDRDRRGLEIQIMELEGRTSEALAASRQLELEGMDAALRPLQERVWALQDEAAAAAKASQVADERLSIERQLRELNGDVAWVRQQELDALDPSNRALLQSLYNRQDELEAIDLANQALEEANRRAQEIADERESLEARVMQLLGDTAALRERELSALDPANRDLLRYIYTLEDAATAASEASQREEERAARERAIADERLGLDRQMLELLGDTAALRQLELDALDPANRALQLRIWAVQDAAAAEAEAAAKAKAITDERLGLERQLLELLGDTAALRQLELDALDPANRALQLYIWAVQDKMAADEAAAEATRKSISASIQQRQEVISQYRDEISSLSSLAGEFYGFASSIREFRAGLFAPDKGSAADYNDSRKQFREVSSLAALGSANALQSFNSVATSYLESAQQNARTLREYKQALGEVSGAAAAAISGAEGVAAEANNQIAVLQLSVDELEQLNVLAESELEALSSISSVQESQVVPALEGIASGQIDLKAAVEAAREGSKAEQAAIVNALQELVRMVRTSWRGDSIAVSNDEDTPLTVA